MELVQGIALWAIERGESTAADADLLAVLNTIQTIALAYLASAEYRRERNAPP